MNNSSILQKYKNTIKTFLEIPQGEKMLYCDNESFAVVNKIFPPSTISKLKIIGISRFDESFDPELIDKVKQYPTLILLYNVINDEMFSKVNTVVCLSENVFMLLLNLKDSVSIEKFKCYENVRYLGMVGMDFTPVSAHIVTGVNSDNIITISGSKPSCIFKCSKSFEISQVANYSQDKKISGMIETMTRISNNNNIFTFVDSNDELIDNVDCWSYEYLLHKYIKLDQTHFRNAKRDPIYEHIRHMDYSNVVKYLAKELEKLKETASTMEISTTLSESLLTHVSSKTKIFFVKLHLSFLDIIKSEIVRNKVFEKSELENLILMGHNPAETWDQQLMSQEKKEFLTRQSKNIGEGECSSLLGYRMRNQSNANIIKTVVAKFKNSKKEINNFFFYISGDVTLEEVAEIENVISAIKQKNTFDIIVMANNIKNTKILYTSFLPECENIASFKPKIFISKENMEDKTFDFLDLQKKINHYHIESSKIFDKNQEHVELLKNEIASHIRNEFEKLQISPENDSYLVRGTKQRKLLELQEIVKKYKKIVNNNDKSQKNFVSDDISTSTNGNYNENDSLLQQMGEEELNSEEIEQREKSIEQIEKSVYEINQLFIDINLMVRDQGEILDSIEMSVLNASDFVQRGVEELQIAENYQKKSHSKAKYILGGLAGIGGIIAIILGTKLKR